MTEPISATATTAEVPFAADWASPPGDTLEEFLEERGWSRAELAVRLGFTAKHVNELLKSRAPITAETAERLERVFGVSAGFWLRLEANYQQDLLRLRHLDALAGDADWLKEIPLSWMRKQGCVETCSHVGRQVQACLRFFAVASVSAWREQYGVPLAAYRASPAFEKKAGAVASWLRRAEIDAAAIACRPYDAKLFRQALAEIRTLTLEPDPAVFLPQLSQLAATAGVALVVVPSPPGCPVSGATRWLTPDRAMVALSMRHKSDDHLWFTFFHEAVHILRHSKKLTFVDGLDGLNPDDEKEADRFAADWLIPPADARRLAGLRAQAEIEDAAQLIGVSAGIVVGRMQHEGWLPRTHLNGLKVRYSWA
jgi:HTH-type transcriptional regulator/antitoxin HigA